MPARRECGSSHLKPWRLRTSALCLSPAVPAGCPGDKGSRQGPLPQPGSRLAAPRPRSAARRWPEQPCRLATMPHVSLQTCSILHAGPWPGALPPRPHLRRPHRLLDLLHAVVAEAGHFHVRPHLGGLRGQPPPAGARGGAACWLGGSSGQAGTRPGGSSARATPRSLAPVTGRATSQAGAGFGHQWGTAQAAAGVRRRAPSPDVDQDALAHGGREDVGRLPAVHLVHQALEHRVRLGVGDHGGKGGVGVAVQPVQRPGNLRAAGEGARDEAGDGRGGVGQQRWVAGLAVQLMWSRAGRQASVASGRVRHMQRAHSCCQLSPFPALHPPPHVLVQLLKVAAGGLRHVPHDAVHHLALSKPVLALLRLAAGGGPRWGSVEGGSLCPVSRWL